MGDPAMLCRAVALLALAAALLPGAQAPVFAADPILMETDPGICADTRFLKKIQSRFRHQVRHVPNLPDVEIEAFRNLREVRYIPTDERRPIDRRYCSGHVVLSSGDSRSIWYLIEGDMGFASFGDNVEFCIAGFDRWRVYNGHCRVLR